MILCGGVFSEASATDHRAVYPGVSQRDGSIVRLLSGLPEKSAIKGRLSRHGADCFRQADLFGTDQSSTIELAFIAQRHLSVELIARKGAEYMAIRKQHAESAASL